MRSELTAKVLQPGDYVCILSPVPKKADGGMSEGSPRHAIQALAGFMTACVGDGVAPDRVIELDLLQPDKVSFVSPVLRMFELPRLDYLDANGLADLVVRMKQHVSPDFKKKMETALGFLGAASETLDATIRFTCLWIALEVSAGTKGKALAALNAASGNRLKEQCKRLKDQRDQLHHKGERYQLSPHEETLIRAAILSVIEQQYNMSGLVSFPESFFQEFEEGVVLE